MKIFPRLIFLSSIIFASAIAAMAQAPPAPPKPAPSGTIQDVPPRIIGVVSWREFTHEAGNFSVMMPDKPFELSQTVESEIGKIPVHTFTAQEGTLIYLAMYAEYPIALDTPGTAKTSLNNARDLMLSKRNGKLISETEISFGKYAGRELKAKVDGGVMRSRTYIVNQRMYMLMVSAAGDDNLKQLDLKKVDDFFVSFKFLNEPQPIEGGAPSMSRLKSEIDNLELPADFVDRPVSWREVASPELGFTVWMPSEPFRKKVPLNPNDRRLDISLWMARSENSIYQMIVQPILATPSNEDHRKLFFRSLLDGILSGGEVKLEGEKPISFEGYPGREYKLRVSSGLGTGRAYIIGAAIYLMLTLPAKKPVESKDESAEIARFFDSFRLTKDPDAAPAAGAAATSWREIAEPGHGFKVLLPGEPKKDSSYSQGVWSYTLLSVADGILYMVTRQRLPFSPDSHYGGESFYKTYIDSFAKSGGFELTGETSVVLDGREGREYKLKKNEKAGVARVFLTGLDVYSISAIAVLREASAKSISTFLDSFKLIEKSPKDEFAGPPAQSMTNPGKPEILEGTVKISGGPILDKAVKKVEPDYPPIAKAARAQGKVIFNITTSGEGKVIQAEIIQGHPLLRDSVLQAVKQWEFKPTEISGVQAKVSAVLTFEFTLK
jgi:TonB family protein